MYDIDEADNSLSLFTDTGERKYLSRSERERFYEALSGIDQIVRTFCEMIFWTGVRPSEARSLTVESINTADCTVTIRSLKKRERQKGKHYRVIPLPRGFVKRLEWVHDITARQRAVNDPRLDHRLWSFSRTTAWKRVAEVMARAGVTGVKACARGLRHSFGVHAALSHVPETRIQRWMGHARLSTTAVYLDMAALEDREMARRMWDAPAAPNNTPQIPAANSDSELLRLIIAYSAIPEPSPRLAHLASIEAAARNPLSTYQGGAPP